MIFATQNKMYNMEKYRNNSIKFYLGMCLYYEDNIDSSFQHFQQVLRLAPEHTKTMNIYKKAKQLKKKKDEGNEAYKLCKFNVSLF